MHNKSDFLIFLGFCLGTIVLINSCSTQTDALPNRVYHQINTQYNGLFYATQYLKEGVSKIEQLHNDDYADIIKINKYADLKAAQAAQNSFDKAIEKSTLAIQKHSMDIDGEEKNKLIDKSYMVIGQSQFYKQEYAQAINTFNYILRQSSNESIKTEALIWSTRCHQNLNNTESLRKNITLLEEDYYLNKEQDAILDEIQAETAIQEEYYLEAKQNLLKVLEKSKNKNKKIRVHYILGQIGILLKDGELALKHFNEVIKKNPEYEMVFNAKLNRAKTYTINRINFDELKSDLNKMIKDSKNKEYLDQIYFVLADIELANNDTTSAVYSLELSAEKSMYNNAQKLSAHYLLAKIFWDKKKYIESYHHCDTAHQLSNPKMTNYLDIKKMLRGVKKIATYYNTIQINDSIISLSRLPENERNIIIDEHIQNLKEKDLEARLENDTRGGGQPFNSYEFNKQAQNNMNITSAGGWYFYNPSAMSLGYSEFLSRWGNRKLEDNWRRKNKNQILLDDELAADSLAVGPTEKEKYNRDYYINQLPKTEEEKLKVLLKIESAYYDLATVFKEDVEDYKQSQKLYNELLEKFPKTDYRQLVYFDLYGVSILKGDSIEALKLINKIKTEYPESDYLPILNGETLTDPKMNQDEKIYIQAYELYMNFSTKSCEQLNQLFVDNKNNIFIAEIELLSVFCDASNIDKKTFINQLELIREKYSKTAISNEIDTIILTLKGELDISPKTIYQNEFKSVHYFLLLIEDININLPETQLAISRFNTQNYKSDTLTTTNLLLTKDLQILKVEDFVNKESALAYYELIQESTLTKNMFNDQKITALVISENNYAQLLQKKEINKYIKYFNEIYLLN